MLFFEFVFLYRIILLFEFSIEESPFPFLLLFQRLQHYNAFLKLLVEFDVTVIKLPKKHQPIYTRSVGTQGELILWHVSNLQQCTQGYKATYLEKTVLV